MSELRRTKIVDMLQNPSFGARVEVKGWVRTIRGNKYVQFIHLNDGSTVNNLQIVADVEKFSDEAFDKITTGSALRVVGTLVESQGKGQTMEIQADEILLYGTADPETYPLQKKGHSPEFMREIAHLRPRTNIFGAIFRMRHHMSYAVHKYFNDHGFFYFHTPIITASDAEGAGQMFQVTTLGLNNPPRTKEGEVDYHEDFFGHSANLTVSGQLEGELGAMALGSIYTFGPTFRAENSNTPRHLAEFWMIEPEVAFSDNEDNMNLAEDFLKYLINYALEYCMDDIQFLNDHVDMFYGTKKNKDEMGLVDRLKFIVNNKFIRITYTEGVKILEESGAKFEYPVYWGADLASEHERYLVEKHFKCPVIMTDYPKEIKSFYMKHNEDGKTVRGMDVLFPKIGEIIGGSERETDYDVLMGRVKDLNMDVSSIWWYLETRKFGTAPHAGFGLGFERLMLFVTGMANIRDVIPFPRTPNNASF